MLSRLAVLLAVLAIPLGGCGIVLTQGPPPGHLEMEDFSCTQSNVGPILDFVFVGMVGVVVIGTLAEADGDTGLAGGAAYAAAGGLLPAAIWGSSGVVGLGKTRRCREAKRLLSERQTSGL